MPAIEMTNTTSSEDREVRKDYADKSDATREHDFICCMASVSLGTPQAIKVDQFNLEIREKTSGTFNED